MSPLSLYHHLLGRALPLFRFLQHFLLVPFLLSPSEPRMETNKNDANPDTGHAPAASREEEEEEDERGEMEAEEEGDGDAEELDVVGVEGDENDDGDEEEEEEEEEDGVDYVLESGPRPRSSRTPFTSLSQVDADLALARTLQEQERAYMMLRMGGGGGVGGGSDFVGSESGSEYELHYEDNEGEDNGSGGQGSAGESDYDEDAFDAQEPSVDIDPSAFDDDEAYARALQDAEEREVAVRLMALAGINDWVAEDAREHGSNSQDTWLEVDPDELSYEELVALGEAVGTENRGLTADTIASLPSVSYKAQTTEEGSNDQCVICRLDYEDGESLIVLSCKHTYHPECINQWLQINKVCPICSVEVSTSENAQG